MKNRQNECMDECVDECMDEILNKIRQALDSEDYD
jgi:hypothetical protein